MLQKAQETFLNRTLGTAASLVKRFSGVRIAKSGWGMFKVSASDLGQRSRGIGLMSFAGKAAFLHPPGRVLDVVRRRTRQRER